MSHEEFTHQIIRASAGSGKTFKLSERYLKLLLEGVPADSILATTFTRKAAGEIQNRILKRLGEGAVSPEGARKLSKELKGDENAIPQERFRSLTIDVVRSINRLRVCTLDAFFMQLAGGYSFEIGLPPGWSIVDDSENRTILHDAIQSTFAQTNGKRAHEISKLLFKGETRKSIESQVFELALSALEIFSESRQADWTLLKETLSGSNATVEECVAALDAAELPTSQAKKKSEDPKPNGNFVKARDALKVALLDKNWKGVLDNGLVKAVLTGVGSYYKIALPESLHDALEQILDLASDEQKEALGTQLEAIWHVVQAITHYFDGAKTTEGSYRFDDLAQKLSEFESKNTFHQTDYRLDAHTKHLLLDEFQDASYKQWSILKPFALAISDQINANLDPKDPKYAEKLASFFCVGDVKQAIYGWRGGVAEIFGAIEKDLIHVESEGMSKNWRSCPTIIQVVNKIFLKISDNTVFKDLPDDEKDPSAQQKKEAVLRGVNKWQKSFEEHQWSESNEDLDGFWTMEIAPRFIEGGDIASCARKGIFDPDGKEVEAADASFLDTLNELDDEDADVDDLFEDLGKKRQKDLTIAYAARRIKNLRERYPRASIGVLARSNDYLARILRSLKKIGVEASEEGGAPLVDAPSVGVLLALFRLAAHPGDSVDAFCIANVEPLAKAVGFNVQNGISPNDVDLNACRRVSSYLRTVLETKGLGNFAAEMRDVIKPVCKDAREIERMNQFVEFAFSYQASSPKSTLDDFVKAAEDYKTQAPSETAVRVMTIHGSKGLEFDIVVLPELDASQRDLADITRSQFIAGRRDPLAPIEAVVKYVGKEERAILPEQFQRYFQNEIQRTIEEALCLLYVAVTRPKRMLLAIVNPDRETKTPSKGAKLSFANILRYGLTNASPLGADSSFYNNPQRIYAYGTADWGDDLKRPRVKDIQAETAPQDDETERPLFRRVARSRYLLHRQSPTDSHETLEWKKPEIFARGKCIHACYENTLWLDLDQIPGDDELRRVLRPLADFDLKQVESALADFHKMCASEFTKLLMSRKTYESRDAKSDAFFSAVPCAVARASELARPRFEVRREWSYRQLKEGGNLLSGVIDRLVLLYDGDRLVAADVVDFKTDQKRPDAELFDEYYDQLKCYGKAIEEKFGLPADKITLRLAFVTLGLIVDARTGASAQFEAIVNRS